MDTKIKKIIAREGLIIIFLISVVGLSLLLNNLQLKRFDSSGYVFLKNIEKYNLFIPDERQIPPGFDWATAMPADSTLSRDNYKEYAEEELLNRKGFSSSYYVLPEEMEYLYERFGEDYRKKSQRAIQKREKIQKAMKSMNPEHLAAIAGISLKHFYDSINQISHLKWKINFKAVAILAYLIYPIYLFIYFIIWAIKTLKQK